MKKTAVLTIFLALASPIVLPTVADGQAEPQADARQSRDLNFSELIAQSDGGGVLLRWQLQSEVGLVGYNLYRLDGELRTKVNESIIPASSLEKSNIVRLGEERQFFDLAGTAGQVYSIEALREDGSRLSGRVILAASVKDLEAEVGISSAAFRQAAVARSGEIENRSPNLTPALSDLVSAYTLAPSPEVQIDIASKPGVKIAVKQDGFYRVYAAELQTAAFPMDSDSTKWRLFADGVEQAINIGPNRSYVEFYGRGVDFPETDTRIYYLIADTVPGKRITTRLLRSVPGSPRARNFQVTAEKRDRREANFELFNGEDENFLGSLFDTNSTLVRFNLSGVDFTEQNAKIKISLFGHSANSHHRVVPVLNGYELAPMLQYGRVFYSETFVVPTEYLNEGENQLELASSVNGDYNIFDKVEVTYKRTYSSDSGKISFYTPGSRAVDLDGFSTGAIRVFDTTFDGNPVLLTGLRPEQSDSGFRVRIPSSRMMVGYALEDTAILQSPSVTANTPSTLSRPTNGADMLIISYSAPGFLAAAENWAAYRRSGPGGGFNTRVVDVADVFDEFNFGMSSAEALRKFLKYTAEQWSTAPKYVLLLGDASYDPRNYEGFGNFNFVPSGPAVYIDDESFSDELLGDFDGDDVSSIAIGRIPARTPDEIAIAFNKMKAYEANQLSFSRGALFASDAPIGFDFAGTNQRLAARLPQGTPIETISSTDAGASASLISGFNRGRFIVNYAGHGASGFWSNSGFFSGDSVAQLTNLNNPSVVTMLTCLSGHFAQNMRVSLAEVLLFSPTGGAAATWASTGSTTADVQSVMGERFFERFAVTTPKRIGDSIKIAKSQTPSGRDVKLSWALLGDPAMRLP